MDGTNYYVKLSGQAERKVATKSAGEVGQEVVQIQISSLQQAIIASLPLNRRFNNEDK